MWLSDLMRERRGRWNARFSRYVANPSCAPDPSAGCMALAARVAVHVGLSKNKASKEDARNPAKNHE